MIRIVLLSLIINICYSLDLVLAFPEGLSADNRKLEIRQQIEKEARSLGGTFRSITIYAKAFLKDRRTHIIEYNIKVNGLGIEVLRNRLSETIPENHELRIIEPSVSAQQGDAPESATNPNPALPAPSLPSR
jgi:hypothetical protein